MTGDATLTIRVGTTLTFAAGLTVDAGARLVVERGATLRFGPDQNLNALGQIEARGTAAEKVRFLRQNAAQRWGSVYLKADGSLLEHVTLDGGYYNIAVQSRNNALNYVTSRNGWRNLTTSTTPTGARSSLSIESGLFENAASVGAVLYFADVLIANTTVRGSGEAGLWVTNAFARLLQQNVVETSGRTSASRDGIEVNSGGEVALVTGAPGGLASYNAVRDNGEHELSVGTGGRLYMGYGANDVTDAAHPSAPGRRVYNGSAYAVDAVNNWWGAAPPPASLFYGAVTYNPWSTSPNTCGTACLRAGPPTNGALAMAALHAGGAGVDAEMDWGAWLLALTEARTALTAGAGNSESGPLAAEVYRLQRMDPDDTQGEADATRALYAGLVVGPAAPEVAERSALVLADEAVQREACAEASELLDEHAALVVSEGAQAEAAASRVSALSGEGRYEEALALLAGNEADLDPGYVAVVEADLLEQIGAEADTSAAPTIPPGGRADLTALPTELALLPPRPNPTRGAARIPFALPAPAAVRVEVFDALGRRVAVVAEGRYEAGLHEGTVGIGTLAAGVYVVRATVSAEGAPASQVLTRRLTVVR